MRSKLPEGRLRSFSEDSEVILIKNKLMKSVPWETFALHGSLENEE